MNGKIKKAMIDFIFLIVGCSTVAFSIIGIMIPNNLTTGGITGFSKILYYLIPINFSILYYVIAISVLIICYLTLGWKESKKIIIMSILFPTTLLIFENINYIFIKSEDMFLPVIYFAILSGLGFALVIKRGYSFGGTDTIAKIIKMKFVPFASISQILFLVDGIAILISGIIFGKTIALYALLIQLIFTKTVDFVLYGFGSQKVMMLIISENYDEINKYIIGKINGGTSLTEIIGGYSQNKKYSITYICSPRESMLAKSYIAKIDMNAFITIVPVSTVWGNHSGFESLAEAQ